MNLYKLSYQHKLGGGVSSIRQRLSLYWYLRFVWLKKGVKFRPHFTGQCFSRVRLRAIGLNYRLISRRSSKASAFPDWSANCTYHRECRPNHNRTEGGNISHIWLDACSLSVGLSIRSMSMRWSPTYSAGWLNQLINNLPSWNKFSVLWTYFWRTQTLADLTHSD